MPMLNQFNVLRDPMGTAANVVHYVGEAAVWATSFGATATFVHAVGESIEGNSPGNELASCAVIGVVGAITVAAAKFGEDRLRRASEDN